MEKTNVMRIIESRKLEYKYYFYDPGTVNGGEVAKSLNEDPERVFKTLVTVGRRGKNYVFMIPVCEELDLKKAAKSVGEKSIEMIKSKDLLPLTGYIHGGCSPIGMKKPFPSTAHITAQNYDTIFFSGGKIGCQVEMSLADLNKIIRVKTSDIIK
ncbi:MAG: Cys-tRNA(Pro) deacylase [Clostridium sp.]|nr:Cys-tRNA(Pro) deacylase [Clostridium sp.]MCM1547891.1 Cys-tRNA(Pro) deacylase [Ruminococcus sp.]